MNTKLIWSLIVVVAVALGIALVSGPARKSPMAGSAHSQPIKIGIVNSLTGSAAPWGESAKKGIDLAVKQINENGGMNGRQVEVVMEDDDTDSKSAVSAYNKLVSVDHVDGVIGGVFDFSATPLIPLALQDRVAFISPQNFRMPGGLDTNAQSFVMMTDFSTVLQQLKAYIAASGAKKLATVHFTSAWGNEVARNIDLISRGLGHGPAINESYAQLGNNDFKTTIAKLKSAGVDAIFIDMFGNDTATFLARAKELGFTPKIITYNSALDGVDNKDGILNGIVVLNWEIANPQFQVLFKDAYGVDAQKSAEKWFDAIYAMANGIANSTSTASVASYIASHSVTTPNSVVSFTANHTAANIPVEIDVVQNGILVPWKK
jgi:branched-chain amino acid transport system substrate-binding protein